MNTNNFISCLHILGSWHFGCNLKKGQCKAKYKLHIQVLKGWSLSLKVSAQIQTILAVLIFWAAPFSAQCSFSICQQSSLSRCSTGLSCFTLCYLIFRAIYYKYYWSDANIDLGKTSMKKKRFLSDIARMMGRGLPMPEFFGPLSRSAFLVSKKSLFLQECQCIELLTVF